MPEESSLLSETSKYSVILVSEGKGLFSPLLIMNLIVIINAILQKSISILKFVNMSATFHEPFEPFQISLGLQTTARQIVSSDR